MPLVAVKKKGSLAWLRSRCFISHADEAENKFSFFGREQARTAQKRREQDKKKTQTCSNFWDVDITTRLLASRRLVVEAEKPPAPKPGVGVRRQGLVFFFLRSRLDENVRASSRLPPTHSHGRLRLFWSYCSMNIDKQFRNGNSRARGGNWVVKPFLAPSKFVFRRIYMENSPSLYESVDGWIICGSRAQFPYKSIIPMRGFTRTGRENREFTFAAVNR